MNNSLPATNSRTVSFFGWHAALIAFALCVPFKSIAYAPPPVLVKTTGGCSIFVDPVYLRHQSNPLFKIEWIGQCRDGLAQGLGKLKISDPYKSSTGNNQFDNIVRTTIDLKAHQGKAFGYFKNESETEWLDTAYAAMRAELKRKNGSGSELGAAPLSGFRFGDRFIRFGGLGLEVNDALLDDNNGTLPTRTTGPAKIWSSIFDSETGGLSMAKTSCWVYTDRFPECEGMKKQYDVYYFSLMEFNLDGSYDSKHSQKTFCPVPTDLASCEQVLLPRTIASSAEQFIRESMPKVMAMNVEMRKSPETLAQDEALEKRQRAETADRVARDQAKNNLALESKLEKAQVGELFAIADEHKSKGDIVHARQALRQLIARFPSHKLATTAASMLADMQGQSK